MKLMFLQMYKLKNIKSVGVELEGIFHCYDCFVNCKDYFWDNYPSYLYNRIEWKSDGSIGCLEEEEYPREITFWSDNLDEILSFVEDVFKFNFYQNGTCGNHIHLKIDKDFNFLSWLIWWFYDEFAKLYYQKFKENPDYTERFENKYCLYVKNRKERRNSRYQIINVYSAWSCHRTIEIRVLPAVNNFKEYKKAFLWVIKTADNLLEQVINQNYMENLNLNKILNLNNQRKFRVAVNFLSL